MKHESRTSSDNTWRVFCAIVIPEKVRESVAEHISLLHRAVPDAQASWSRPENIHLTLKFVGEIPQTQVALLSSATSRAVSSSNPFRIKLEQTGFFPAQGSARVLWIGISDDDGKLAHLHGRLEDECAKEGFENEARRFHPHLTVARLRKPHGARTLAAAHRQLEFKPAEILVSELLVIRSELGKNGSQYTTISRHPLVASNKGK